MQSFKTFPLDMKHSWKLSQEPGYFLRVCLCLTMVFWFTMALKFVFSQGNSK